MAVVSLQQNFLGTKRAIRGLVPESVALSLRFCRGQSVSANNKNDRERVIDENLKKVFGETLEEGIPDRFKNLLDQLREQDNSKGASS
jgi:hypothetical protein